MTNENREKAMQSNVKFLLLIQIFLSSLRENRTSLTNFLSNQSAMKEFNEQMNFQGELTRNIRSMTIESMKLQLSTLIQLTETTNQLTRQTLVNLKIFSLIFHSNR